MATKPIFAVGTPAWVSAEQENVIKLLQQEKEELVFPAQHEMEWLNEHMAEIFSRSHVDVANVFKTPGKLRGKTPRTARKRNVADSRVPLSDVFSSKPLPIQSPQNKPNSDRDSPKFAIAVDDQEPKVSKSQTDSGYHGSSQAEIEVGVKDNDAIEPSNKPLPSPQMQSHIPNKLLDSIKDEGRTTEGSFHSAKEDQTTKVLVVEGPKSTHETLDNGVSRLHDQEDAEKKPAQLPITQLQIQTHCGFDEIGSPSDESTPDRPLVRKSSLTFASLPAREPLKQSIGNRITRTSHLESTRQQGPNKTSQIAHFAAHAIGSDSSIIHGDDVDEDVEMEDDEDDDDDGNVEILGYDDSNVDIQIAKEYSKSSTQRLQEKIDMLGKAPPPRTSKSIPSALAAAIHSETIHQQTKSEDQKKSVNNDEDDWIKPLPLQNEETHSTVDEPNLENMVDRLEQEDSEEGEDFDLRAPELIAHEERVRTPVRRSPSPGKSRPGYGHAKSASTATLVSPSKAAMSSPPSPAKSISGSNPAFPTTTPQGSPRKYFDGTLSASKSKLQSIMKTAKGLFTSSAGVSAAAKLETLSPNALRMASKTMPGMYPSLGNMLEDKPLPNSPGRATRNLQSSAEREKEEKRKEKEAKAMQKMEHQLEKVREQEKQKAFTQKQNQEKAMMSKALQQADASPKQVVEDEGLHGQADTQLSTVQVTVPKPTRPVKPARDAVPKTKPAPVAIRVGTLSQRMPMNTSSLASSTQDILPAEPKRPGLSKQPSTASMQSSSSTATFKSSVNAHPTKPRALLAAERKKEQDEREAQRKLEQRREIERKRAAQQEDARRQEQKLRGEAERKERERIAAEQVKRQAQQQAIERKRQQNVRKVEEQRLERATTEDNSSTRPPSRLGSQAVGRSLINHPLPTNPAKPPKRQLDEDPNAGRTQASKYGAASQQSDLKRRKTEDECLVDNPPRPTISGAPVRQSNLGKKPSIFSHSGYAPAPQPGHLNQFPPTNRNIPQMSQFANGAKIPFAEAPNPPAQSKTPGSIHQPKTIQAVKSSPQYPNGEAIHLPEIPTDSEDEDSEDEGNALPIPDWATPGHLTDQLIRQEGMDGDAVFGPIAPLKMEEIFAKTNKERLKRLRDRTSSANWAISGDGLTLEEVRHDREQRERMRLEGGWRYGG